MRPGGGLFGEEYHEVEPDEEASSSLPGAPPLRGQGVGGTQ